MLAATFALLLLTQPPPPPEPPPALPEEVQLALAAAEKMERDRAFAAAAEQVTGLLPLVGGELRSELSLRACHLRQRSGDAAGAQGCFAKVVDDARAAEDARALARYYAALLLEPAAAREAMRLAVISAPDTTGGLRALAWLRGDRQAAGPRAEADLLLGIASELAQRGHGKGSTRYAEALSEAGRLRLEAGDAARAAATLQTARAAAEGTVWADDALYWSARAARAQERWDEALGFYEQLIAGRQVSFFVGSYDSEHFDDALLEVGQLFEGLGREEQAHRAYERLEDEAPRSRLVDDAAYGLARLDGTPQAFADFVSRYPESRHRAAAAARAAAPSRP